MCVLFLTAKDAVDDRVAGITVRGDDYVTKPFSLEESAGPAAPACSAGPGLRRVPGRPRPSWSSVTCP